MKKILTLGIGCLFFGLLLNSCSKNPLNHMTQEESRIYITKMDSSAQFNSYHTFSIVDSVAVINNSGQGKALTEDDAHLISLIKTALENRGYQLVDTIQNPDLGINVSRISHTYLNVVSSPYDYWGYPGYGGTGAWGYPGYNYYFPPSFGYYPPSFRYFNTRSDVMLIDLIDLKNAGKNGELKGIWNASLKGEGVLDPKNYDSEIKAIFDQSPYLKTGK